MGSINWRLIGTNLSLPRTAPSNPSRKSWLDSIKRAESHSSAVAITDSYAVMWKMVNVTLQFWLYFSRNQKKAFCSLKLDPPGHCPMYCLRWIIFKVPVFCIPYSTFYPRLKLLSVYIFGLQYLNYSHYFVIHSCLLIHVNSLRQIWNLLFSSVLHLTYHRSRRISQITFLIYLFGLIHSFNVFDACARFPFILPRLQWAPIGFQGR